MSTMSENGTAACTILKGVEREREPHLWSIDRGFRKIAMPVEGESHIVSANGRGQVIGLAHDKAQSGGSRGFVFSQAGGLKTLTVEGHTLVRPAAINDNGWIVGTAMSAETKKTVACIWKGGTKGTVFKPMNEGDAEYHAVAINNANAVAGFSIKRLGEEGAKGRWKRKKKNRTQPLIRNANYTNAPWIWTVNKGMVALPIPVKEGRGTIIAMNDRGDVLMQYYTKAKAHFFLITDKGAIELPEYPEAARTKYRDVNSKRQLVGSAYMDGQGSLGFVAKIPDK